MNYLDNSGLGVDERINKPALLTREQEIELGRKLIYAKEKLKKALRKYHIRLPRTYENLRKIIIDESRNLTEREKGKLERLVDNIKELVNIFVVYNKNLAKKIARRHISNNVDYKNNYNDFSQEGIFGIMEAAWKYDYKKGMKFSTYETWWIRQKIQRKVVVYRCPIRLPVYIERKLKKVVKARRTSLEGDISSISEKTELEEGEVSQMLKILKRKVLSLDERDNEERKKFEFPVKSEQERVEYKIDIEYSLRNILNSYILDKRERIILSLRYLTGNNRIRVLEENSEIFGVRKKRIRQLEEEIKKFQENNGTDVEEIIKSKNLGEKEKIMMLFMYRNRNGELATLGEVGKLFGLSRERIRQLEAGSIEKLRRERK